MYDSTWYTYINTYIHYITSHYITLHYTTLHYITLHYTTLHYITLHYTTLHYITLHYTTLHYITLHYTTLHYITLHYTTLHYITLHYTTLHYITLHCTTLHYIALHCTTLHYIALHCTTLHYIALHCTTLHYIALHCTTLHYIALHYIHTYIHTQRITEVHTIIIYIYIQIRSYMNCIAISTVAIHFDICGCVASTIELRSPELVINSLDTRTIELLSLGDAMTCRGLRGALVHRFLWVHMHQALPPPLPPPPWDGSHILAPYEIFPLPPLWCGGGVALSPSPPVVWWGCGMVCWVCMVCMVGLVWHEWLVLYGW